MPQLDVTTYASQLFWLLLTFVPLYLVITKVALPRIGEVLEARQDKIDDDLKKAAARKEEAEAVMSEYEALQADAHAKAQALLRETQEAMKAEAAASKAFTGGGVSADLPTFEIAKADFADGPSTTALLRAGELVASNGEARRKMGEGAVRVNDEKVAADQTHGWGDVLAEVDAFKVQVGKKRIALVKPV